MAGGVSFREGSFNPRPPLPRGDAGEVLSLAEVSAGFNPRPPLPRGDAVCVGYLPMSGQTFQSTPPVAEGRCSAAASVRSSASLFQSTPPVAEGRCDNGSGGISGDEGFNPRPPLPRGDARWRRRQFADQQVSIHAPRCRGAMPRRDDRRPRCLPVSIHAPRCRGAMRANRLVQRGDFSGFNPRPPLPRGDACLFPTPSLIGLTCFNPRPPLPRGDANREATQGSILTVSIHAPRCRGAMQNVPAQ